MRRGEPALLRNSSLLVPGSIPGWGDAEPHENADSLSLSGFAASGLRDERAWRVMLSSSRREQKKPLLPARERRDEFA
jgi:hypothetical protein